MIEARPNRRAENWSGVGLLVRGHKLRLGGLGSNVRSHAVSFPQWGPGRKPGKLVFLSMLGPQKSCQNGLSDNVFF